MKTPAPHTLTTDKEMKINLAYMEWNIEGYILKVHLSFLVILEGFDLLGVKACSGIY